MHRNSQSYDYRNYSHIPRSTSISSRNTHRQFYEPRSMSISSRTAHRQFYEPRSMSISSRNAHRQFYEPRSYNQPSLYPYPTMNAFNPSYLQQQYQPLTTISDVPEPVSLFDELGFLQHRQPNVTPFPPVCIPPNSNRSIPANGTPFATANALRERLLIDIQQNMNEIDHELAVLERRPIMPLYIPIRISSLHARIAPPYHENRIRSNGHKKVYKVVPRITNQVKAIVKHSTPIRAIQNISPSFIGQYHYGPEMEENEIRDDDPENIERNLVVKEIPKLDFSKPLTLDEFRRQQSAFPENRALVSVPEFLGNDEPVVIKKVDASHQSDPINTDIAPPVPLITQEEVSATPKLKFRNFESLIQNAAESNVASPTPSKQIENKTFDANRVNLINSMLSKPVKHTPSSTKLQTDIEKPPTPTLPKMFKSFSSNGDSDVNGTFFLNDNANDSFNPDGLISVYPDKRSLRTESKLKTDEIIDTDTNEQQLPKENNHENLKETNPQKIDPAKKYVITAAYTLPSSSTT